MVERFTKGWVSMVTQHPKAALTAIVALLVLAGAGLPNFKLDASADSLTLEHDTDLTYFRDVSKNYNNGDFLVVTYNPKKDLFSDESLKSLAGLQADLAVIEGVESVNSILNVPLLYSPKQSLREIASKPRTLSDLNSKDRAMARQEFLESPIYRNLILSPDGQTTAIQLNMAVDRGYIELVQKRDELRAKRQNEGLNDQQQQTLEQVTAEFLAYRTQSEARGHARVEQVRAVVDNYKSDAEIFVGGVSMITADMVSYIKKDLMVFGSGVVAFMILVLAIIFRSVKFVVIPMATCLSAVFLMLGLISWLDWRLTVISSNFVALLLIISLAIIIHLVVRYREYAAEYPNWTQQELVQATVIYMAKPCLYTTLTTVVAFASLVVSDIRPVIDFGWMMTLGLIFALVLAFVLLPASLMLLPRDVVKSTGATNSPDAKPLTAYCAQVVERHGPKVVFCSLLLAALSIWGLSRLQVENRFIDYFHKSTEIYQGLSVIDNKLGGTTSLDIIIQKQAVKPPNVPAPATTSQEQDPFADMAAAQAELEQEFAEQGGANLASEEDDFGFDEGFEEGFEQDFDHNVLTEQGERSGESGGTSYWMTVGGLSIVEGVHDYLDGLPEVGKVQSLGILYKVGKDINGGLNDFELAVLEKSLTPEINDVLVAPFLRGKDETRITMRIKDSYPGLKRFELVQRIKHHLSNDLNLDGAYVRTTGLLVLYNNMLQSLFSSQIITMGAVFFGILVMFMVLFRSLKIAIVAVIPNILAAFCILGGMGLAGIPLDMMTITIAAITVGIGVDDTIHYIHRFQTELKVDGDYMAAMHRAHRSIGRAMYYTSVIIVFGFSIMVFSQFIPTIYFGILTGLAMFAALAGALFLLPKLILWVRPFKSVPSL